MRDFWNSWTKLLHEPPLQAYKMEQAKEVVLATQRHADGRIISQLESEFSEDGMGIVPQVLACINTYFADSSKGPLPILFELVRDWKIPEILQLGTAERSVEP